MSKVSKAFKALNGLSEDEKLELEDLFNKDEEKEEKQEEQKEEKQEEKKEKQEEKKEVKKEDKYLDLFEKLNEKIDTLTKEVEKSKPFGAQQKQGKGKEGNEFDDMFANLRSQQRS